MIAQHPALKRSYIAELLELDGLPAWEAAGKTFTRALHRHSPSDRSLVIVRSGNDIDRLLTHAAHCVIAACEGLELARGILAERPPMGA